MNTLSKTRDPALVAVIVAIIVIMTFVSLLGYIPPGLMNMITVRIPVIIGAIILGSKYGILLGLTFDLTSLWKDTSTPNPTPFVFSSSVIMGQLHGNPGSLVIYLVPRILIGAVVYHVHRLFMRMSKDRRNKQGAVLFAVGVAGSLTNTLLVMSLIYPLLGDQYASATNWTIKWVYGVILGIIGVQEVPEALVAGIIVTTVTGVLLKVTPGSRGQAGNWVYIRYSNVVLQYAHPVGVAPETVLSCDFFVDIWESPLGEGEFLLHN